MKSVCLVYRRHNEIGIELVLAVCETKESARRYIEMVGGDNETYHYFIDERRFYED